MKIKMLQKLLVETLAKYGNLEVYSEYDGFCRTATKGIIVEPIIDDCEFLTSNLKIRELSVVIKEK